MKDILIEFMDSLRDYVAESGANIATDERDSSEFVDIFLNSDGVSERNWFQRMPLHWRYLYYMGGGILLGLMLPYMF